MIRRTLGTLLAAGGLLAAPPVEAALNVQHQSVECVLAERHPRLEARITPEAEVGRARVFFRAAGTPHWYSVEMTSQAGSWHGVLPKPKASAARIEYYLEAIDKAFVPTRTDERAAEVAQVPGACRKDAAIAAASPSARVVVTAAAGAPAVPAGFLKAGLLAAGGGLSAGVVAGIIGGGAAVGGAVLASRGQHEGPDEPPPTIAGSWSGAGADGMSRDMVNAQNLPSCHRSDDLFFELQQSGGAVTGNARYVSRPGTTCNLEPFGTVRAFTVTGSLDGTTVNLTLFLMLPNGPSIHILVGTLAGSRMSGMVTSTFPDGGGRGTWSVRRP